METTRQRSFLRGLARQLEHDSSLDRSFVDFHGGWAGGGGGEKREGEGKLMVVGRRDDARDPREDEGSKRATSRGSVPLMRSWTRHSHVDLYHLFWSGAGMMLAVEQRGTFSNIIEIHVFYTGGCAVLTQRTRETKQQKNRQRSSKSPIQPSLELALLLRDEVLNPAALDEGLDVGDHLHLHDLASVLGLGSHVREEADVVHAVELRVNVRL